MSNSIQILLEYRWNYRPSPNSIIQNFARAPLPIPISAVSITIDLKRIKMAGKRILTLKLFLELWFYSSHNVWSFRVRLREVHMDRALWFKLSGRRRLLLHKVIHLFVKGVVQGETIFIASVGVPGRTRPLSFTEMRKRCIVHQLQRNEQLEE